jgi:hypothetical protein
MKLHILFSIAFLVVGSFTAFGQTTNVADKDITWRAGSLTDKNYSKNISSPHRLVTHGRTSMELHRGTEQTLTFTILSVTGTWSDEKTTGKLEYDVRSTNGALGKVTVERKGSSTTAWVDFTQTNRNGLNIELKIDSIE